MDFPDSGGVVRREECPKCSSSDNVAVYLDGHKHCFGQGCGFHTGPSGETGEVRSRKVASGMIDGEFRALPPRGLSLEACQKFGVRVGKLGAETVLSMDYKDQDGNVVAQKVRKQDKTFTILGDPKAMTLFGQHLWPATGRKVVITEGELDAVALCQMQDLKWPVVSIQNGSTSAKKSLAKAMDWLNGYEEVILAFDNDDAGRLATAEAAACFPVGRVKIANMPHGCKDANEALLKGEDRAMLKAIWDARAWRPDGIVSVSEIKERVLAKVPMGRPYPFKGVTEATYGRHPGDVIGFGGGTGCGKTDLFSQMIDYDTRVLKVPTGVIYLEQNVTETVRRIAGKAAGKVFHAPDGTWTQEQLETAVDALDATQNLHLYDSWGAMDWATIQSRIDYMVQGLGCEHIYLDHLTALAAAEDDERKALEKIMAAAASQAQRLGHVLHYVSHLATPEGKSHEEGGRVMAKHFKGSRAIQYWSHTMWGIERDTQAQDVRRRSVSTLRNLKDRLTGRALGQTWLLGYDQATGLSRETTEAELGFSQADEEMSNRAGF